jgi:uncharacterized protein (DUF924 family)
VSVTAKEVVDFWRDSGPERWFSKDETFDDMCEMAFEDAYDEAARGDLDDWMADAQGALALVLLLDQMPRNMFRGTAKVFAADTKAREVADHAIAQGFDAQVEDILRPFFYLPFSHSEDPADQERAVELNRGLGTPDADKWALHHQSIIQKFGRFPHRNEVLGRESTPEEKAWLDEGGFKG